MGALTDHCYLVVLMRNHFIGGNWLIEKDDIIVKRSNPFKLESKKR